MSLAEKEFQTMNSTFIFVVLFVLAHLPEVVSSIKREDSHELLQIADLPECQEEANKYCSDKKNSNFELLGCLNNGISMQDQLSDECQHLVWQAKNNLTKAVSFTINGISAKSCEQDIDSISDCKYEKENNGPVIPCLLEFEERVKDKTCNVYLDFLKPLIFSDYRLVYKLVNSCSEYIEKYKCGRLNNYSPKLIKDQGSTIDCLAESFHSLNLACKREILKLSELQSRDWNNDRPLYLACLKDRYELCHNVVSGNGLVYKCLYKHKMNPEMSDRCREKLRLRQKLEQEDYSINYGLASGCHDDIKEYQCEDEPKNKKEFVHAGLSRIILCLEEAKLSGKSIKSECLVEMKAVRFSLLEDHKINPEVVTSCKAEISRCEDSEVSKQPFVIHCLMELARLRRNRKFNSSSACVDAVENLLLEVDIRDDIDIDPALMQDCQMSINKRCASVKSGGGRVIDCLMSLVNHKHSLNEKCLNRLMEVQYFFSRNFKLSRRFMVVCKNDAKKVCLATFEADDPKNQLDILSCLYRNKQNNKVTGVCIDELKKLMADRARSVDLPPHIQESCMNDLVIFCPNKVERDEEMYCLEDNYDLLSKECKERVSKEVESEEEIPQLSRIFIDSCDIFWKEKCSDEKYDVKKLDDEDGVGTIKCLIENKNDPNIPKKCKDGIEHHQLMTMKEVKLSMHFNRACKSDIGAHCPNMLKKVDIIKCLSDHVFNDSMLDHKSRIVKKCRKQLNFELLQIRENINMDDDLKSNCKWDREQFCSDVDAGRGEVIECLRKHQEELRTKCRELIFKNELKEVIDTSIDYTLMINCKEMIKTFCKDESEDIFNCLKKKRNEASFDDRCRSVLLNRMRLRSQDIRLNPVLMKACENDIENYCPKEMEMAKKNAYEIEGIVIHCLRKVFVHKNDGRKMTISCVDHISTVIKESAIDYMQDATLVRACKDVIVGYCLREVERHRMDEDNMDVEGCLRTTLLEKIDVREKHTQCFTEILRRLSENKVDLHIDPILNRVCYVDAKTLCREYNRGEGRVMSCLLSAMTDASVPMSDACRKALRERSELWSLAVKLAPPENLGELYEHIQSSSAKTYFQLLLFSTVCLIFVGGLFFGRVTKRVSLQSKKR